MEWIHIYYVTCMGNSCPPLPTSFHRVSAVFIFRWYSHKWVGPDGCGQQPGAWDTREVKKTQGDAAEKNWAWWDHCYFFTTINTGSPNLTLPTPHSYLEGRFWNLPHQKHSTWILSFKLLSGCQAWIWEALSRYTQGIVWDCPNTAAKVAYGYQWNVYTCISLIPRPVLVWD